MSNEISTALITGGILLIAKAIEHVVQKRKGRAEEKNISAKTDVEKATEDSIVQKTARELISDIKQALKEAKQERDAMRQERNAMRQERDEAREERDQLREKVNGLTIRVKELEEKLK